VGYLEILQRERQRLEILRQAKMVGDHAIFHRVYKRHRTIGTVPVMRKSDRKAALFLPSTCMFIEPVRRERDGCQTVGREERA
jgi:hypothetical protein